MRLGTTILRCRKSRLYFSQWCIQSIICRRRGNSNILFVLLREGMEKMLEIQIFEIFRPFQESIYFLCILLYHPGNNISLIVQKNPVKATNNRLREFRNFHNFGVFRMILLLVQENKKKVRTTDVKNSNSYNIEDPYFDRSIWEGVQTISLLVQKSSKMVSTMYLNKKAFLSFLYWRDYHLHRFLWE